MLVDITTLIVEIVLLLLISALAWAVWWKIIDKGWKHLEKVLGKKITGWISTVTLFVVIIAIVIDMVRP